MKTSGDTNIPPAIVTEVHSVCSMLGAGEGNLEKMYVAVHSEMQTGDQAGCKGASAQRTSHPDMQNQGFLEVVSTPRFEVTQPGEEQGKALLLSIGVTQEPNRAFRSLGKVSKCSNILSCFIGNCGSNSVPVWGQPLQGKRLLGGQPHKEGFLRHGVGIARLPGWALPPGEHFTLCSSRKQQVVYIL